MSQRFPRSCYDRAGGLVYFPRMLDKIRLHAAGDLPPAYHDNLGTGFDARACALLGVDYAEVRTRTLEGGTDEEIFAWCAVRGHRPSEPETEVWNGFMMKRGWRDAATPTLRRRLKESGLEARAAELLTMFDYIEADEGRTPPPLD